MLMRMRLKLMHLLIFCFVIVSIVSYLSLGFYLEKNIVAQPSWVRLLLPKTRGQVMRAYAKFVDLRNGVNKVEASIIAQLEMMRSEKDNMYDISKPYIMLEKYSGFLVRFPPKSSFIFKGLVPNFWVSVEKDDGRINYFGEPESSLYSLSSDKKIFLTSTNMHNSK